MKLRQQKIAAFVLIFAAILLLANAFDVLPIPSSKHINVPFSTQAPYGNWEEPWQNACEETAIYMVAHFYKNASVSAENATEEIKNTLAIKNKEIGASHDESLETIQALIKKLGNPFHTNLVNNPSLRKLKHELAKNRPIIVPVYAPKLGLDVYLGPVDYHVFVLTGYDDATQTFLVNDPGTSNGENMRIPYETLMSAIHNLSAPNYEAGAKAVLFTSP